MLGAARAAIRRLERRRGGQAFLTPALVDVTEVDRRPDAELFGPLLQIVRVPDFESALVEANATRYG
jgi:succinylglutamic semialdehyde dehydrogenase